MASIWGEAVGDDGAYAYADTERCPAICCACCMCGEAIELHYEDALELGGEFCSQACADEARAEAERGEAIDARDAADAADEAAQ